MPHYAAARRHAGLREAIFFASASSGCNVRPHKKTLAAARANACETAVPIDPAAAYTTEFLPLRVHVTVAAGVAPSTLFSLVAPHQLCLRDDMPLHRLFDVAP